MLSQTEALELYRKLLLVRLVEERITSEYSKDEMKTPAHLGIGGEAIGVGVVHALPKGSKLFGTYRNHALFLTASNDTDSFFGEMYGKENGCAKGKAGSMHMSCPEHGLIMTSAVVGTTIPVAVGAALAQKYKGHEEPVAVFFGDGAVEEGVFWESVNFACAHKLKILFVCEDNELAIHTFKEDRRGFQSLGKVIGDFDLNFAEGDGKNIDKVVASTQDMLKQMEANGKPGFLHLDYFRMVQHVGPGHDFDAGYRKRPDDMQSLDPVLNFEKYILKAGVSEKEMQLIRSELNTKIDNSVKLAQQAPFPGKHELYTDIFVEA